MPPRFSSLSWGIALLLGGLLILLFNFGVFDVLRPGLEYIIAGLATALGLGFVGYYAYNRAQWWPVLPGLTFLGVAAMIYLSTQPGIRNETLTSVLFLALAIAFAIVYVANPHNWWAVIPGGILLVIGFIILLTPHLTVNQLGILLFVGIGLVFFLVYLLGPVKREVWWALIPGTALIVSGLFIYVLTEGREQLVAKLWPLMLILGGLVLIGRRLAHWRSAPSEATPAPAPTSPEPSPELPAAEEQPPAGSPKTAVIEMDTLDQDDTASQKPEELA